MSRHDLRSLIFAFALCAAIAGGAVGVFGAVSTERTLSAVLAPSESPSLLGPIDENGRTGWACKPERAAAASSARDAELPSAGGAP